MDSEEKKAYLLLKSVIFHYHGLDDEEKKNLEESTTEIDGHEEMQWVNDFIAEDYFNSFDRARNYLNDIIGNYPKDKRVFYIDMVWKANNLKGYVTELEATAMLQLARDWQVEEDLINILRNSHS
ncbi:hypothetical protein LVD15_08665 [Fulvivirga maritima]|uniref:hypothetical protein n=1 Tax=Fulvivirga maritima TaxID=2904247 RepID=UPI001F3B5125|nr:hypothetical protein [Fulvivirga maritima]UII28486.1 hypothetical protein LVD15_08665 [Fulvivirga maritima]